MTSMITLILAASVASMALAAPTIDWFSIDAGGAVSSGATISVRGVIGQPDAGPVLSGGTIELSGGFLSALGVAAADPGCNVADVAEPFGLLDLGDISAFTGGFLGGDLIADLDGNNLLDLVDINLFVAAFLGGCP